MRLLTVAEPSAPSGRFSEVEQAKRGRFRKPFQRRRETPFAQAACRWFESSRGSQLSTHEVIQFVGTFYMQKAQTFRAFSDFGVLIDREGIGESWLAT